MMSSQISTFGTKCYDFWYAEGPYQYHVFSFMVLIASVITFWPFFAGYHDTILELSVMRTNLQSIENIVASTVVITLAVPLIIDGILDFALSLLIDRNKAKEPTDIFNYVERAYIYSGLLIFPICAFVSQQYTDLGLLALCCSRCQYCVIYGGCVMGLSRVAPHCFPTRLCMLAIGFYYIARNLFTYSYLHMDKLSYSNLMFYYAISNVLTFFTFSIFMMMVLCWLWLNYVRHCFTQRTSSAIAIMNQSISSSSEINIIEEGLTLKNDIKTRNNLYLSILTILGTIFTIILLTISAEFPNFTPTNLAFVHIAFSNLALGLLIYHLRKFRSDALLRLHALVNKKATLLKYVHELYEPISTIYKAQKNMMEELGEVSAKTCYLMCSWK